MFYTYVLKSLKNNRYYIGSTNDLKRRLEEHNFGKSKYTKATRPFRLVYYEKYQTKAQAVQRELFLKTGKGREYLKTKLQY